jgi:hypothetical protein
MTRVSELAEHWFGLCRRAPGVRATHSKCEDSSETTLEGNPDGGAGGPGTIRRGIGAAQYGAKTLIHNRQLLWFTLMVGVVLAGHLIAQAGLIVFPSSSDCRFFFDPETTRLLPSLILTFAAGFLTVFCIGFLLSGLVLSIPSKENGQIVSIQGLTRAKKYLVPLTAGSVVVSLSGIQLFVHPSIVQGVLFVRNPRWILFVDPTTASFFTSFFLIIAIEFLTVFCLIFLVTGLTLSLSSKNGGTVSFLQGLVKAKEFVKPLAMWSMVVAFAGSLLFTAGEYSYLLSSAIWQSMFGVLNQFPFNYALNYMIPPDLRIASLPPVMEWGLSIALVNTLILSAINVLLFVLTMFVVPLLVLDRRSMKDAVLGSFTLMKRIWGEVATCFLGLGLVVFAASLMVLLFRFSGVDQVWWDAGRMYISYSPPTEAWAAAGILYILVLISLALIIATIGGIAALDLYTSAKSRQI